MKKITKIKFVYNLEWIANNTKHYIIYRKIEDPVICFRITKGNKTKIQEIKTKIQNETNPPLNIQNIIWKNKTFHLIQESDLVAGTKQRVAELFAKTQITDQTKYLTYSGSYNGYGAVACAYASHKMGLKSKVFLSMVGTGSTEKTSQTDIENSKQINTILALGGEIYLCPTYKMARNLKYDYATLITKNGYEPKKEYSILPMGLNDDENIMVQLLASQILKASKNTVLKDYSRIWLVAGSGGILGALHKTFPNSTFYVYLTGGGKYKQNVINFVKKYKNIFIVNDYDISDMSEIPKLYETVLNYDEKIIPYVLKYGKSGDFIWNVACD